MFACSAPDRARAMEVYPIQLKSSEETKVLEEASLREKSVEKAQEEDILPILPSPNSCLTASEVEELQALLNEFQDRFNDGSRPIGATIFLKATLDTGYCPPISCPRRRLPP